MLDAAHGQRVGPVVRVQGVHVGCSEPDVARARMVGRKGRRRPPPTAVADGRQGSRRVVAVARSRRCEAIAGMNAAEGRNNGFCCECRCVHLVRNVGRSLRGTPCGPAPGARSQTLKLPITHCSQTPRQTGICNWRQRGKVEGKDVRFVRKSTNVECKPNS